MHLPLRHTLFPGLDEDIELIIRAYKEAHPDAPVSL
jgi:hypothetical protein